MSPPAAPLAGAIVLVGPLPPPAGGMANQTRQLARLLEGEGCAVRVVRSNADYRPAWIGRVRYVRALFRLAPYLAALWRATSHAALVHVMANSGWAWHFFAAPAVWIASWRGVPVVVNYRGGEAERFLARGHALVRPTLARAGAIVVPSGFLAGVFGRYGVRTAIIPNIVDPAAFRPAQSWPPSPHVVVTRNLEAIYDVGTAIRAFARLREALPAARMTIAGEGPQRSRLEALVDSLGLGAAVRFAGRLDNAKLPALYRSASAAVNPSLADNMPISVLEALACGVPVVSTNVGGVPHLVEHERTAMLVPPAAPEAMAAALLRVHRDAALAQTLRHNGLAHASDHAWPAVRERWLAVYAALSRTPIRPAEAT